MRSALRAGLYGVALAYALGGCAENEPRAAASPAAPPASHAVEPAASPAAPAVPAAPAPVSHAAESCGELAMMREGLLAEGKGPNHPEVRGVEALLERCTDRSPTADECERVRRLRVEARAAGKGDAHPYVVNLAAREKLCAR